LKAILWDGNKQIHGFLILESEHLVFRLNDFAETSLHLIIPYDEIESVVKYKLYGFVNKAIRINSKEGKRNVFVVQDVEELKGKLSERLFQI
jgi:hypothetical protein